MLDIKNFTVTLKNNSAFSLRNINLAIHPGEINLLIGPNGAGKSSLGKAVLGFPEFLTEGEILLNQENIISLTLEERARKGIFLSHQNPVEVPGVKMIEFLRVAYNNMRKPEDRIDSWAFLDVFIAKIKEIGLENSFAERSLNEGFSGGEKKKSELLQLMILEPKFAILDEIDSGLDIDSTKNTYEIIKKIAKESNTGFLIISHNPSILNYITPNRVFLLNNGTIEKEDGIDLAKDIIDKGFKID